MLVPLPCISPCPLNGFPPIHLKLQHLNWETDLRLELFYGDTDKHLRVPEHLRYVEQRSGKRIWIFSNEDHRWHFHSYCPVMQPRLWKKSLMIHSILDWKKNSRHLLLLTLIQTIDVWCQRMLNLFERGSTQNQCCHLSEEFKCKSIFEWKTTPMSTYGDFDKMSNHFQILF